MAEKFDEFLEEVENDIRQERYLNLWRKYGKTITNVAVGVLVLGAAYTLWNNHEFKKRQQASDKYVAAQQLIIQGSFDQAQSLLNELAGESVKTYPTLAQFVLAGVKVQKGSDDDLAEARAIYEKLAASSSEVLWRDFARYQALSIRLNQAETPDEALLGELKEFASAQSTLAPLVSELYGMALLKKNNKTEAAEVFVKLAQSKDAGEGVAMRAQLVAQILASQG